MLWFILNYLVTDRHSLVSQIFDSLHLNGMTLSVSTAYCTDLVNEKYFEISHAHHVLPNLQERPLCPFHYRLLVTMMQCHPRIYFISFNNNCH